MQHNITPRGKQLRELQGQTGRNIMARITVANQDDGQNHYVVLSTERRHIRAPHGAQETQQEAEEALFLTAPDARLQEETRQMER